MPQSPEWLFRGLESAGVDARRSAPARIATAAVGFLLMLPQIELGLLSAWTAAVIACEVWTIFATRGLNAAHPATRSQRTRYLISCLATTWVWNLAPMILWASGDPGLRIIAVVILAGFLIHAQGFAYRSWLVLLINGGSSTLNLLLLPVLFGGLAPVQQATLYGALALLAAYAMVSATMARGAHEALDAARVEAEAASEAKSAFLAMMSHELRTPMNGVLGMAHALGRTDLTDQQARFVDTLLRSGGGLMTILNDVLDLAKIEAGKFDIEARAFDLRQTLTRTCDLWRPAAEEKGLAFSCDIAPEVPDWV
ncbi:MAG TPA: histidine kinase dimerization/phospho-acceptor domain-containing protein, partial [Phenylobacterium sp.]|nr:histidine kinase dimerization/phospho-acceptor domain-containing protein [Phenylobacterium sp.]